MIPNSSSQPTPWARLREFSRAPRSQVIVAGYFVLAEELEPDEALQRVAAKREMNLSDGLESLLWQL